MPFPEHSPYEILDVPSSATLPQLMKAYQTAIKQKRFPTATVFQAFQQLKNARARAEHDLLELGQLGDPTQVRAALDGLPRQPFLDPDDVPWPEPPAIALPTPADLAADELPIPSFPFEYARPDERADRLVALPPIPYPA